MFEDGTHWLAPLPPKPIWNFVPCSVSPTTGRRGTYAVRSVLHAPTTTTSTPMIGREEGEERVCNTIPISQSFCGFAPLVVCCRCIRACTVDGQVPRVTGNPSDLPEYGARAAVHQHPHPPTHHPQTQRLTPRPPLPLSLRIPLGACSETAAFYLAVCAASVFISCNTVSPVRPDQHTSSNNISSRRSPMAAAAAAAAAPAAAAAAHGQAAMVMGDDDHGDRPVAPAAWQTCRFLGWPAASVPALKPLSS